MGDFLDSVQLGDFLYGLDRGRKPAMNAEHVRVDDARDWQVVEHVGEVLPHVRVAVFILALHVEAVVLG